MTEKVATARRGAPARAARFMASLLACAGNVQRAAKEAGVAERTAHRMMREPDFKERLEQASDELLDDAVRETKTVARAAVRALAALLDSEDERTRCRAAEALLMHASRILDRRVPSSLPTTIMVQYEDGTPQRGPTHGVLSVPPTLSMEEWQRRNPPPAPRKDDDDAS